MRPLRKIATAIAVGAALMAGAAQAESTVYGTHDSTSGSYVDYMKTV
jgi:hypothetical protein